MPIKGLTEKRRMPRIGKFHLGIKVTKNKQGKECTPYPKAVDYFVYPEADAEGGELIDQLTKAFGEKPKELRIIFPLEDEESIASQYYRCYTRSRGLVCRGDGEVCMRMLDAKTGALPTKDTDKTTLKEMTCQGRECPDYDAGQCREVMNLQFMLPEISGMGVWQIDTSSINSIRNINSCLEMIKAVYGRVAMVPMLLTLEKMEVTPPGGTKKNVYVLNIRSTDTMVEAAIKAQKPFLELVAGPPDLAQAEADIAAYWPQDEKDRKLSDEEAAERMTQQEIESATVEEETEEPEPEVAEPAQITALAEPIPQAEPNCNQCEFTNENDLCDKGHAERQPGEAGFATQCPDFTPKQTAPPEGKSAIDMDWLKESLPKAKFPEKTAVSWIVSKFKVKGGLLKDVLLRLTKQQQEEFVKEIQDRLEMV